MNIIDIHTHLFNLRYLPLSGILQRYHVPKALAKALSVIFNAITENDESIKKQFITKFENKYYDESGSLRPDKDPEYIWLSRHIVCAVDEEVFFTPDMQAAIRYLYDDCNEFYMVENAEYEDHVEHVKNILNHIEQYFKKPDDWFDSLYSFLNWVILMIQGESEIFETLDLMYGSGVESEGVSLYVNHMMDMKNWYKGKPKYHFEKKQIPRMKRLAEKEAYAGKIISFVAYDPAKAQCTASDCSINEELKAALRNGFAGVKFYPANGFKPVGNEDVEIDRANDALFKYCQCSGIPIFTHCTPTGFQAAKGLGKNADPKYWEKVLNKYSGLKLCFAHAGGGAFWFKYEGADEEQKLEYRYGQDVCRLCMEFENVYCGFGYHDEILDDDNLTRLRDRLVELHCGGKGKFNIMSKIMYGTDWHMIHKLSSHPDYMQSFLDVFNHNDLLSYKEAFFFTNAVHYLDFDNYLKRNSGYLSTSAGKKIREKLQDLLP